MSKYKTEDIRNIAFCGHGSAGKTTLADKLLIKTGTGQPAGQRRRRHQHLRLRRRGEAPPATSIESTLVHFDHAGKHFNVIDTPGYPDFIGQTIGALRGRRYGRDRDQRPRGIEVNTRRVFAGGGQGRPGPDDRHQQDGRARTSTSPACLASIQELFGNAVHAAERADRQRQRLQGRGQHAEAAGRRRRGAGRSRRDCTSR